MEVLVFSTQWCCSCKEIKPSLEKLEENNKDIKFTHYEADNCDISILNRYEVDELPTIFLIDGDKIISKYTYSAGTLAEWMKKYKK